MERPCEGPGHVGFVFAALAVAIAATVIGFSAEVQLSAKVIPISVIRHGDHIYHGKLRVAVPLRPDADGPAEFIGELEIAVLSNVNWALYASLADGPEDGAPVEGDVTVVLGREKIAVGVRPTLIASGSNGVFPLRLHLRAAPSPEARGSTRGEVVLLLTLATQVRP